MRAALAELIEPFQHEGRLYKPLLFLYLLISALVLTNAILHDPRRGYDGKDHVNYIASLAADWRLPTKAETGQYYSPPLPYFLPALLTALQVGSWKALKFAQLINVLLAMGVLFYLLKICREVSPHNPRLGLLSLGLLGLLPVFYRSFALIRGEPYLAFLAVFITYQSLSIFLKRRYSIKAILLLGVALGLAILARQWGFFLLPAVVVAGFAAGLRGDRWRVWLSTVGVILIAALVGGWFYVSIYRQYGTLTAFDRGAKPVSLASASILLGMDGSLPGLFSDPFRPNFSGKLIPTLYADMWGDYWGYFLIYARNISTGRYLAGELIQDYASPALVPAEISTNRFEMSRYLGGLNVLGLLPTAIFVCGLAYGILILFRFVRGRVKNDLEAALALCAMIAGVSLLGFLWFIIRYQTDKENGDLIKATYLLQAYPALAFLGAGFIDRAWSKRPRALRALTIALGGFFALATPTFVTHYVHLSIAPAQAWFLLSTLLFVGGIVLTYWIHTCYVLDIVVKPVAPPDAGPLISVCIPARNEARNIRRSVQAALAQTYPNFEVIVLDDRSTDATPQILEELSVDRRLHVLHGSELPEGWAGKPHALVQAVAAARGEWLCFLDADTFLKPEALAACYRAALDTRADLFTMLTRQVAGSFWERVVMPLVMTALSVGFPPRDVNDPKSPRAVANGQFILIRRSVYEEFGGHARIKDEIVDDKAMAELVKYSGHHLVLADGTHVARTRMYTSFATLWEGWTKNVFLGLRHQPNLVLLGAFGATLLVLSALFLPVWPLLGLLWLLRGGGLLALGVVLEALMVWASLLYARAEVDHAMQISRWYALTLPLGAAVFAAIMLTSAWRVTSGRGVTWRGRRYTPGRTA